VPISSFNQTFFYFLFAEVADVSLPRLILAKISFSFSCGFKHNSQHHNVICSCFVEHSLSSTREPYCWSGWEVGFCTNQAESQSGRRVIYIAHEPYRSEITEKCFKTYQKMPENIEEIHNKLNGNVT
jgi:hypothetical protein